MYSVLTYIYHFTIQFNQMSVHVWYGKEWSRKFWPRILNRSIHCIKIIYPRKTNMTMENPPCEDVSSIKNGGLSIAMLVLRCIILTLLRLGGYSGTGLPTNSSPQLAPPSWLPLSSPVVPDVRSDGPQGCGWIWWGGRTPRNTDWVVVSNIFYFHPCPGEMIRFDYFFQMGLNHQLD